MNAHRRTTAACLWVTALATSMAAATQRPEIRATHGVVAAGRSHAADAGARIMAAGGNAIDGGVATILAAAVVEISHFGLGGEVPIIIYSARDKEVIVINGQGFAPKAATPAMFAGKDAIPGNGPLGATIPAVIDSVAIALTRYGTRSFGEVAASAIELADGFPMYEFLRRYLASERAGSEPYSATMETYYPGGRITPTGEMFRQPNLARTLRALVAAEDAVRRAGGSREAGIAAARGAFYKGDIARRIVAANRAAGGVFTEDDLAAYQGRVEKPVSVTYRGFDVYKTGPWGQGPVLLQTLRLLEGFDLAAMGSQSADALHTIVEAMKLAYADRDKYYADPDFARVPLDALLAEPYTVQRRRLIDPARASLEQRPGSPAGVTTAATRTRASVSAVPVTAATSRPSRSGDTTAVEVVDAAGNLFSATPSSGWLLGGAFVAGDTGVPLSNRMQAFRLEPESPNVLAGRKRPRTTLTPTIVMRDGRPFLAIGTPGGDNQDQQILLVLLNVIDFGMNIQAAIEAPRVNSLHPESSFGDHRAEPGVLEVEGTLAPAVIEDLKARGHVVQLRSAWGVSTGVVAAGVDPGTGKLRGGADPRRERYVVAW